MLISFDSQMLFSSLVRSFSIPNMLLRKFLKGPLGQDGLIVELLSFWGIVIEPDTTFAVYCPPSAKETMVYTEFMKLYGQRTLLYDKVTDFLQSHPEAEYVPIAMQCLSPLSPVGPAQILSWLYLGDMWVTETFLLERNITDVISVMPEEHAPRFACISGGRQTFIPILDMVQTDLLSHIGPVIALLKAHEKAQNNVYIHCAAGISRSVSLVIAYLMTEHQELLQSPPTNTPNTPNLPKTPKTPMSLTERAYRYVVQRRRVAEPNLGFMTQLMAYETTLLKQHTM